MDRRSRDARIAAKLGPAVKAARDARGWSQATLAEHADVSVDFVGLIERGERLPALGTVVEFAGLLGTTVSTLLGVPEVGPSWSARVTATLELMDEDSRTIVLAMVDAAGEASRRRGAKVGRARRGR